MTEAAKSLRDARNKAEETGNLSESFSKQFEQAITIAEDFENYGTFCLDVLAQKEQQNHLNVNQRLKLSYKMFDGSLSQWNVFLKNQKQLFSFYADQPEQQLFQLSRIATPSIAKTLLTFSGSANGAEKALEWLHLKYGTPHLQKPSFHGEIKAIPHAKTQSDVPQTVERILGKIKSLSLLVQDDEQSLPTDLTNTIFRALYLWTEEKRDFASTEKCKRNLPGNHPYVYGRAFPSIQTDESDNQQTLASKQASSSSP